MPQHGDGFSANVAGQWSRDVQRGRLAIPSRRTADSQGRPVPARPRASIRCGSSPCPAESEAVRFDTPSMAGGRKPQLPQGLHGETPRGVLWVPCACFHAGALGFSAAERGWKFVGLFFVIPLDLQG